MSDKTEGQLQKIEEVRQAQPRAKMDPPPDMHGRGEGPCETVKIKAGDSYVVINKSDFKEGEHVLFDAPPAKSKSRTKE